MGPLTGTLLNQLRRVPQEIDDPSGGPTVEGAGDVLDLGVSLSEERFAPGTSHYANRRC